MPTKFLTKDQIPTTKRFGPWVQTEIITGKRSGEGCSEQALVGKTTKLRMIWEEEERGEIITQYVVRTPTRSSGPRPLPHG